MCTNIIHESSFKAHGDDKDGFDDDDNGDNVYDCNVYDDDSNDNCNVYGDDCNVYADNNVYDVGYLLLWRGRQVLLIGAVDHFGDASNLKTVSVSPSKCSNVQCFTIKMFKCLMFHHEHVQMPNKIHAVIITI